MTTTMTTLSIFLNSFALLSSILKLLAQVDQFRLLKKKSSIYNLSFDHHLICIVSYGCSFSSSMLYLFVPLIRKQYMKRYPTNELPLVKGIILLDLIGLIVSVSLLIKMYFVRSRQLSEPVLRQRAAEEFEANSKLLLSILLLITTVGMYILYMCFHSRRALYWLDLIDYIWFVGTALDPFRLVPQLVKHWLMDSILPGLSLSYSKYQFSSVAALLCARLVLSLSSTPTNWLQIPFNIGTYYYLIVYSLMLFTLQLQIRFYKKVGSRIPKHYHKQNESQLPT